MRLDARYRMPTGQSREDHFVSSFLSAYEDGAWADAKTTKPDAIDRTNPAIDKLATRKSDRNTLAIEHTIIEPFVGEKKDFAFFETALLAIETDESLVVPGRWIQVFVPVGTLQNQPKRVAREAIAHSVHNWIKSTGLQLRDGTSQHRCAISGIRGRPAYDITLTLKVVPLRAGPGVETGILHVRRQQLDNNLGKVIEGALRKKLPKLVNTAADKRILLLERQHMNLYPESMLDEIERLRPAFPQLAHVDEIWILETIFYETAFGGTYFRFELYENGELVRDLDFKDGRQI